MVEQTGFEPAASCVQKQALYQLSYSPTRRDLYCARRRMVEDAGIEPAYVLFPKQETLLESDPR